jgi:hypothetical protein
MNGKAALTIPFIASGKVCANRFIVQPGAKSLGFCSQGGPDLRKSRQTKPAGDNVAV